MIGRACLDFEIGMDRSLNVNNGEIRSVDEPLPRETGWRIQTCFTQCVLNSFVDLVLFGFLNSEFELMLLNVLSYASYHH